jgi:hypothetical protein
MRYDTIRDLDWHLDCEHSSEEAGMDAEKKGTYKSSKDMRRSSARSMLSIALAARIIC